MNGGPRTRRAWFGGISFLFCALGAGAMMNDDDQDGPEPPDVCTAHVVGLSGEVFLDGLPVIQQELEVVADTVKVAVETPPRCRIVTPPSLPFVWEVFGPGGPVVLSSAGTLRPGFRPLVAGAYQARLTYCPNTCPNKHVGNAFIDIPPQSTSLTIIVHDRMPVPPATKPVLTPTALTGPTAQQIADAVAFHEERNRKCGFPDSLSDISTPQLVPVRHWGGSGDYGLLEGFVKGTSIAYNDNALNHHSHDIGIFVKPDPQHELVMVPGKDEMDIEWESNYFPGSMRPSAGDRISTYGFQTYDCHHSPIATEIHPPVLTAVHRSRAVRIPDGWAPAGGVPLGSNIWVPGVITDVWANVNAGEISSNCSDTGLHQEATFIAFPIPRINWGDCIRSPHPIRRAYSFNIYLPEDPRERVARAGLAAPPAPLHFRVEPGSGPEPVVVREVDGGVTFLRVFIDLTGYTGETYERRIVAGWVQPSPHNWGLERWKFGIPSMLVVDDHDDIDDGDWVFWAALNNRDEEWIRLLDENSVDEGTYTFGGRPWETESPHADRSLGPHLLLFNPPFSQYFPGSPGVDLTRSLELHTSGYDSEFWDDRVGLVNTVLTPSSTLPIGQRRTLTQGSSIGDYKLTYFYERLGPVAGATLSAAGQAVADDYTIGAEGRCTRTPRNLCLLLPEFGPVVSAWDPSQEPAPPGDVEFDWFGHAIFKPQEPEPFSLTEMPLDHLGRGLLTMLQSAPDRAQQFFTELREEFDAVRGGALESDYARALPAFEAHLPADQWQLHFGDIDPTPADLAVTGLTMSSPGAAAGERVTFAAEIANQGTGAAAPFGVRLDIDGAALRVVSIPALAAGAVTVVEFPAWVAEAGPHQLAATADALALIREPEEQDNLLERRIVIGPAPAGLPDLSVLTVDPGEAPRAGRPVTFVARLQNKGGNALASFTVLFAVDGAEIGEAVVPGLAAGEQVDVTSPRPWTAQARRHTVQATADALAAEPESNEGNNALARAFASARGACGIPERRRL